MFNLIYEKWMPVECSSGAIRKIAPWEIADRNDPPIRMAFSRPDLNSALTQFLVALMQTASAPVDTYEWLDILEKPLPSEVLKERFEKVKGYFDLFSDTHPFMQEIGVVPDRSLSIIIATSPGDNTIRYNKDFFIKRDDKTICLCPSCAAAALYTIQSIGPIGGAGQRGSVRGMSPLTTMLECSDLYSTVVSNLLPIKHFGASDDSKLTFPWTLDSCPDKLTPEGCNPVLIYWSTPKRLRFGPLKRGRCAFCGFEGEVVKTCGQKTKGTQYREWMHPLCPYVCDDKDVKPVPALDNINHLNQWVPLLYEESSKIAPAKTVKNIMVNYDEVNEILGKENIRLWISGYVNNKALPISWKEAREPIPVNCTSDELFNIRASVRRILILSEYGDRVLYKSIRKLADSRDPKIALEEYWCDLDREFTGIQSLLSKTEVALEEWVKVVRNTVTEVFGRCAETVSFDHFRNVAIARYDLDKKMSDKSIKKEYSRYE